MLISKRPETWAISEQIISEVPAQQIDIVHLLERRAAPEQAYEAEFMEQLRGRGVFTAMPQSQAQG